MASGHGAERVAALDVLKGAAIVLVVFNHALLWPMREGDLPSAFLYGTAFGTVAAFAAVAGYLRGLRPPSSERMLLARRARQLLLPWAMAVPVYAAAPYVWQALGGGRLPIGFEPGPWVREIVLGGGPLWFLPVLFVSHAICSWLAHRTRSWWPAAVAVAGYAVLAVLSSVSNVSPLDLGRGTFWPVAPLYVAAFWFGIRLAEDGRPAVRVAPGIAVVVTTMLASGGVTLIRALVPEARWLMWLPYAIGLVGGCVALSSAVLWRTLTVTPVPLAAAARGLARAGRASLVVYILHPVVVVPGALLLGGRGGAPAALVLTLVTLVVATLAAERAIVAA